MSNNSERKFIVNPEGEAEVIELTEEEKQKATQQGGKKKMLGLERDRRFIADEHGNTVIAGDNKEKLAIKKPDGSVEKFIG